MGWGQIPPVVKEARLNDEIRKRGVRINAAKAILAKDWRGRYAQDLQAELLEILEGW